jgi:hypothetical protein
MIILNTRINRKIQKYNNGFDIKKSSIIKGLNSQFRGILYDNVKQIYNKNDNAKTLSHISTHTQPIRHITRFDLNYVHKYIGRIIWYIDESLIDHVKLKIGGACIDKCYQPYFKNIRKIFNLQHNAVPLHVVNDNLYNSNAMGQELCIYFKDNVQLPQSMNIDIYYYNTEYTSVFFKIAFPLYQTLLRHPYDGNFILYKIIIPLNIENIILQLNLFKISLKRLDYYNNKSVFSLSDYYQSNDIMTYGLSLSMVKEISIYNEHNNEEVNDQICYVVLNIIRFDDACCGVAFAN